MFINGFIEVAVTMTGMPPGVCPRRVSVGRKFIESLLVINGRTVYKTFCRTARDSDHALVCAKLPIGFDGRSKRMVWRRLDCDKLSDPACLSIFRNALAEKLGLFLPRNIN